MLTMLWGTWIPLARRPCLWMLPEMLKYMNGISKLLHDILCIPSLFILLSPPSPCCTCVCLVFSPLSPPLNGTLSSSFSFYVPVSVATPFPLSPPLNGTLSSSSLFTCILSSLSPPSLSHFPLLPPLHISLPPFLIALLTMHVIGTSCD